MTYKLINISKQCPEAIGTKINKMSNSISSSMYHSNMKLGSFSCYSIAALHKACGESNSTLYFTTAALKKNVNTDHFKQIVL